MRDAQLVGCRLTHIHPLGLWRHRAALGREIAVILDHLCGDAAVSLCHICITLDADCEVSALLVTRSHKKAESGLQIQSAAFINCAFNGVGSAIDVLVLVDTTNPHGISLYRGHILRINGHLASSHIHFSAHSYIAVHETADREAVVANLGHRGLTCCNHTCRGMGYHVTRAGKVVNCDLCLGRFTHSRRGTSLGAEVAGSECTAVACQRGGTDARRRLCRNTACRGHLSEGVLVARLRSRAC